MRKRITLLLILVLAGIGIVSYLLVLVLKETENLAPGKPSSMNEVRIPTPTEATQSHNLKLFGEVTGKLCFPSEFIPELDVYLENLKTGEIMTQKTLENQANYTFSDVPSGSYQAYAYTSGGGIGGTYSPAVPCGLSVECVDHAPSSFFVAGGSKVEGIDICDWYSQKDVPPRP